jgi:hypothetical protein
MNAIRRIIHDDETFLKAAAMVIAGVSAYFTFWFVKGTSDDPTMGTALGLALALAALAGCKIWPYVLRAIDARDWKRAWPIGIAAVLCLASDAWTNAGSVLWQRTNSLQAAKVQTVRYDDARDQVADNRASLKFWTERLQKLEAEHAWSATVTADGLRAQLPALEVALKREGNNCGKRKCATEDQGRGPAWQRLAKEKADLEGKIALAEEKADLTKKIEATKLVLAERRDKAAEHAPKISSAGVQNTSLAVIWSGDLNPDDETKAWMNYVTGLFLGLFLTFAAPLLSIVTNKRDAVTPFSPGRAEPPAAPTQILDDFITNLNRHVPQGLPKFA